MVTIMTDHDDEKIEKLMEDFGVRYVIRNYKLTDKTIAKIINNEYSCLYEENDITIEEITQYQKYVSISESISESNISSKIQLTSQICYSFPIQILCVTTSRRSSPRR